MPVRKKGCKATTLRSSLDGESVNIYLTRTQSGDSILSNGGVSRLMATDAPPSGSIQYHKDLYLARRLPSQILTNGHHRYSKGSH